MENNEKLLEKCEAAHRKWVKKLTWIMSLKEGDIVTRIANMPESIGHASYKLWPGEFIERSYLTKLIPQLYQNDIINLKPLEKFVTVLPVNALVMLTGVTKLGYLNGNCNRFAELYYYHAHEEKKEEIKADYEQVLGPGTFNKMSGRYTLLIPFPQVMVFGEHRIGYIEPHVLKRVKE